MKKILRKGLLTLACTILLTACTDSGPKGATEAFIDALRDGDMKTMGKYSTEATISLIGMSIGLSCGDLENTSCIKSLSKDEVIKGYEVISESETQAAVNVKVEKNGSVKNARYNLIKTEDGWKVDLKK